MIELTSILPVPAGRKTGAAVSTLVAGGDFALVLGAAQGPEVRQAPAGAGKPLPFPVPDAPTQVEPASVIPARLDVAAFGQDAVSPAGRTLTALPPVEPGYIARLQPFPTQTVPDPLSAASPKPSVPAAPAPETGEGALPLAHAPTQILLASNGRKDADGGRQAATASRQPSAEIAALPPQDLPLASISAEASPVTAEPLPTPDSAASTPVGSVQLPLGSREHQTRPATIQARSQPVLTSPAKIAAPGQAEGEEPTEPGASRIEKEAKQPRTEHRPARVTAPQSGEAGDAPTILDLPASELAREPAPEAIARPDTMPAVVAAAMPTNGAAIAAPPSGPSPAPASPSSMHTRPLRETPHVAPHSIRAENTIPSAESQMLPASAPTVQTAAAPARPGAEQSIERPTTALPTSSMPAPDQVPTSARTPANRAAPGEPLPSRQQAASPMLQPVDLRGETRAVPAPDGTSGFATPAVQPQVQTRPVTAPRRSPQPAPASTVAADSGSAAIDVQSPGTVTAPLAGAPAAADHPAAASASPALGAVTSQQPSVPRTAAPTPAASPATGAMASAPGDVARSSSVASEAPSPAAQEAVSMSPLQSRVEAGSSPTRPPQPASATIAHAAPQPAPAQLTPPPPRPAGEVFAAALHAARLTSPDDRAVDPLAPATVGAPLANGSAAIAPAAVPAGAPVDPRQEAGLHVMVDRIEQLRDLANANDTRIRLVPDALGAVDIALRREGEAVHVHLRTETQQAAQLLADAQPRLAEIAESRGVRLSGTTVEASPAASPAQQSSHQAQGGSQSSSQGAAHGSSHGQPQGQATPPRPARPAAAAPPRAQPGEDSTRTSDARVA